MVDEEGVRQGDRQGDGEEGEEGRQGSPRHRTQRMLRSGGAPKDVLCSIRLVAGRPGFHHRQGHDYRGALEGATQQPEILFTNENE